MGVILGVLGFQMAPTWLPEPPRRLQDDPGRVQDASCTPPGPPQHLPRRLQDRPQRAEDAPKALQEPARRLSELPRALQQLSRKAFGDPKPPLRASVSLQQLSKRACGDPKPPLRAIWGSFPCLQVLPCSLQDLQVASAGRVESLTLSSFWSTPTPRSRTMPGPQAGSKP